jgi:hypothetical protein
LIDLVLDIDESKTLQLAKSFSANENFVLALEKPSFFPTSD